MKPSGKIYWLALLLQLTDVIVGPPINDQEWDLVLPFTRSLFASQPYFSGRDVVILQSLLRRYDGISLVVDGVFGPKSSRALEYFQVREGIIPADGRLDIPTARLVLDKLMYDGYKDDGVIPPWAKFKMYAPVHRNRSIETTGILYDGAGNVLYKFPIRSRGWTGRLGQELNQLTTNGDSPTGLVTFDLNSKQPDPKAFGPYPCLRCVKGLKGNVAIGKDNVTGIDGPDTFLSNYRSGILVHTGQWDNWSPGQPMPNSHGCFHVYPNDMKTIVDILMKQLGVINRKNPFGRLPYPYEPQGIMSIEQVDW